MKKIELWHGDCLEEMKKIPDGSIDMILCDLPYGTTRCKWDTVIPFEPLWEQYERIIKENSAIVLCCTQPFASALLMSNPSLFKYEWIWQKEAGTGFFNAKKQPLRDHESIFVFSKHPHSYYPQKTSGKPYVCKKGGDSEIYDQGYSDNIITINKGDRYPKTVQRFNRDRNRFHPTQKPITLLEYLIRTYTQENEIVLDNCMGGGSTGVACINTNRRFIGIEKEQKYFDISKQRIQEHITMTNKEK